MWLFNKLIVVLKLNNNDPERISSMFIETNINIKLPVKYYLINSEKYFEGYRTINHYPIKSVCTKEEIPELNNASHEVSELNIHAKPLAQSWFAWFSPWAGSSVESGKENASYFNYCSIL